MKELKDLSKLCVHTITTKPWGLEEALEQYSNRGIGGISIWKETYGDLGVVKAADLIKQYPLEVVSLVRGGFFANGSKKVRDQSILKNKRLIEDAATIGAPLIVLVCGSDPNQSLEISRSQITQGIDAILPFAESMDVKLGIEPLHPMYSDTRSAINTLKQSNDLSALFDSAHLGSVLDLYHLWWDESLKKEIIRCGKLNKLFAFHICDWKTPTADMLNDRGLMGEGCIPIKEIRGWAEEAGFQGFNEVEIFSEKYWSMDQNSFLSNLTSAYLKHS